MNLRIKTGQLPGDIGKRSKQKMLEASLKQKDDVEWKRSKALKKLVRMSEKAVLKERARVMVENDV